jgi:hypothetical protein
VASSGGVATSSQIISPWFPSLPASFCGRTFALTVEGTPKGNDNDDKITPSDNDNNGSIKIVKLSHSTRMVEFL